MKKLLALLLSLLLVLALAACGSEAADAPAQSGEAADPNQFGGDLLARIQAQQNGEGSGGEAAAGANTSGAGWQEVDQSEGFGAYRTEEELLAILESGELYTYETAFEQAAEPLVVEAEQEGGEDFTYDPGEGVSGVVSEAEAAGKVKGGLVYLDWKSMMDPEALAEWEAFDPNDPEMLAEMEELDRQGEEAQRQLDEVNESIDMDEINRQMEEAMKEAQKELENIKLPEGYEDLLGGLDLDSLLGGLR